jgi:quercetin dioxygenase-like cupin family protein
MTDGTGALRTTVVATSAAPKAESDWGSTSWCIGAAAGNCRTMTFGRVVINRGHSNPRHRHATCDEILYLLSGELEHFADDIEPVRMRPTDAIVIPAGVSHFARCVGETDAEMIVVYSSPSRDFELA